MNNLLTPQTDPGSARDPRAGDGGSPSRTFPFTAPGGKACFGESPKPARESRALPGFSGRHGRHYTKCLLN